MKDSAGEARSATLRWTVPGGGYAGSRTLSGLDCLRGWRDGSLTMPPVGQVLGVQFGEIEHGRLTLTMPLRDFMTNDWGVVLGGMVASALDVALGCVVMTVVPAECDVASLDLRVEFLRPVRDGSVVVEAECVHVDRHRTLAIARLTTPDGRLCAVGTSSGLIRPKRQ